MNQKTRKVRVGHVVSTKMDKTVVVAVEWQRTHPLYKKRIRRITKLLAHDEKSESSIGDHVSITSTRPFSKTKRWRINQILQRRDVAEIKPIELDEALQAEFAKMPSVDPPTEDAQATVETDTVETESNPPTEDAQATVETDTVETESNPPTEDAQATVETDTVDKDKK
jgi:small subunit ribosomal protein S17